MGPRPSIVLRPGVSMVLAAVLLVAGCHRPTRPAPPGAASGSAVVVSSFNFPESVLLAEIYAQALEHAGIAVKRELNLGPRELVQPAMRQGLVDLVPEYVGSALSSLEPPGAAPPADTADATSRLTGALSAWSFNALQPAAAQDQNGLAVTRATADRYHLVTIGDLARVEGGLSLAGPSECLNRPLCELGLEKTYGLSFSRFLPLDAEDQRATALVEGVATTAIIFTTDGALASGDLVLLQDDRRLQPPENVIPVVSTRAMARYGARLSQTLNAVSARLTTQDLVFLNWRVQVAGKDPVAESAGWLARQGLVSVRG